MNVYRALKILSGFKCLKKGLVTTEDDAPSEGPCTSKTDADIQKLGQLI